MTVLGRSDDRCRNLFHSEGGRHQAGPTEPAVRDRCRSCIGDVKERDRHPAQDLMRHLVHGIRRHDNRRSASFGIQHAHPLLKRLESAGHLSRTRNASNERQVLVALTDQGRALQHKAGCLSEGLLAASTQTPPELAALNRDVRYLRDAIYSQIGGWDAPA